MCLTFSFQVPWHIFISSLFQSSNVIYEKDTNYIHLSVLVLPEADTLRLGVAGEKNRADLWYYHLPNLLPFAPLPSFINFIAISSSFSFTVCSAIDRKSKSFLPQKYLYDLLVLSNIKLLIIFLPKCPLRECWQPTTEQF